MPRTVKIWTTVDKRLKDEIKALSKELGFRSESDCLREAIRLGTRNLMARHSLSAGFTKKRDSILLVSGLVSKEWESMKSGELELKMRAQWK